MASKSEIEFLEGPRSRAKELIFTLKTVLDLIRGFRGLHFVGPCITFFGSARFAPDHPYYKFTEKAAGAFAQLGFTIMTGGGPGLMEAANKGAQAVGGRSVGCNISLAREQKPNPYLDKWVNMNHFFTRKILLVKYSFAFVVLPGGYGTLDECFEALTLIQTQKIRDFPVIVFDRKYHQSLLEHIAKMKEEGTIAENDLSLFLVTDDISEAETFVKMHSIKKFNLRPKRKIKPFKWLFEHS